MLKIESLTLMRGSKVLLKNADAVIHRGQRVALVGTNGVGKSSLFKLILNELSPDEGSLQIPGGCRIAHMAQEVEEVQRSAIDYVMDGHQQLRKLQKQLAEAEDAGDEQALVSLHADLDEIEAYRAPVIAEQLLHGLGFGQQQICLPMSDFSGGWRIRLNLAQALMCPSDILLLDEPTNHLDLDAIFWLEQWLKSYQGTLIFISHDRDFIDSVSTHIVHMYQQRLDLYTGTYSQFELQRAQRLAQQQSAFDKQQQRIGEIHRFVNRFKAKATKARQAQSRLKELERMEMIAPAHVDSPFHFEFPRAEKMSSPLLGLNQADLGYGDRTVLSQVNLSILPDMRIGLLGPNGAGKSTFIKTLVDDLSVLSGERVTGENLKIGYFAQHQLEALDVHASPLLHFQRLQADALEQNIRNFLGGFGFHGDEATGPITSFSGGEKARLALALIAWQRPNLLLLDEPTNHLDLEMRHALTVALQGFEGAMVVVSHDRHLLKNTVDQFWLVAHGEVREFDGDIKAYESWLSNYETDSKRIADDRQSDNESAESRRDRKRIEAENRKRLSPMKKRLSVLEQTVEDAEHKLAELTKKLSANDLYSNESKEQLQQLLEQERDWKKKLQDAELAWLDLSAEIESIESSFA